MKRDITIERHYPHRPDAIWRSLANREAMAEWLMPNTFEPRVGHRFEFRARPAPGFDGIVRSQVITLDPPRTLAFTWTGGGIDTVVRFELEAVGAGTRLRLTHSGFAGPKGVLLSFMLGNGWKGMLDRGLPRVLDAAASAAPGASGTPGCAQKTLFWRLFDRVFSR